MASEADSIIAQLALTPHPEGGYYAETFRSPIEIKSAGHDGRRAASTAIYFLLRAGEFSALHRVRSDEVWHHYAGDPVELVLLHDDGRSEHVALGSELARGSRPQWVVPANQWQAARVREGGAHGYALCGCTVAPGFEFRDFTMPSRAELSALYPAQASLICELTR
jgi:predicted cupin superfamily sugar epimerase